MRSRHRTRPQRDGVCTCCRRHVGTSSLVWDHCHECGRERGHICGPCNTALTEHLIFHWKPATDYLSAHRDQCLSHPRLIDVPVVQADSRPSGATRRVYMGQGRDDPRFVQCSADPKYVTIEQLAALWGVTAGTARDKIVGRSGLGQRTRITHLIPVEDAFLHIKERWNL